MNIDFTLKLPQKTIFAQQSYPTLSSLTQRYGKRPLVITGQGSLKKKSAHMALIKSLDQCSDRLFQATIPGEPSPKMVDDIVHQHSSDNIDCVIGVGGGSVLDGAKAISVMFTEKGSVTELLEGVGTRKPTGNRLPLILVPTTSGTGSEATCNAVISSVGPNGFKKSLRHDNYLPDLALVDPALMQGCPPSISGPCGMDCLSQLVEGFLSTKANGITDSFALEGIRHAARSLELSCKQGENLEVRSDMAYATLLSGMVLTNAGLGTVHGFASVIGGSHPIPHGVVCGRLMAPTNRATLKRLRHSDKESPALSKYRVLGEILSCKENRATSWYQDFFIDELDRLADSIELSGFGKYGLSPEDIPAIVQDTGNKNNPVSLSHEDLYAIVKSCL